MEKRLGTLILYFCAEGDQLVNPQIIFPLKPKTDKEGNIDPTQPASPKIKKERAKYNKNVVVLFQDNAWANARTSEVSFKIACRKIPKGSLLTLDNLNGHRTPAYKAIAATNQTFLLYTPPDCTDLCAVNDHGLGKWFRDKIKKEFLNEYKRKEKIWDQKNIDASERRIRLVEWVSKAWVEIKKYPLMIRKAFQACGVLARVDGSENHRIKVKTCA